MLTRENVIEKHSSCQGGKVFRFDLIKRSCAQIETDRTHGFRGIGRMRDWGTFLVFTEC